MSFPTDYDLPSSVPVPIPSITVTGTATAGTTLSLTCDYTLSPSVDTSPHTAVTWMVDGTAVDTSPDRISTGGATLSFSPVATSDSGRYTCQLTVTTSQTHVTVQGPVESAEREITVEGNYIYGNGIVFQCSLPPALPDPVVMISPVDTTVTAGDPLTVQCTMTVIPYLAVQPTVELLGPDGSVLATTNMDLMVDLTLAPVRTSDAGQYTCRASVVIASVSVDASGQSSSTLTVESESVAVYMPLMLLYKLSVCVSNAHVLRHGKVTC